MNRMVIIALKRLRDHWTTPGRGDSERPLRAWYTLVTESDWSCPADVKQAARSASFVGERVVFNIHGNKYRLIVRFNYHTRTAYIRFVGTHGEYDAIEDVRNI